jgi:hypothetical protein
VWALRLEGVELSSGGPAADGAFATGRRFRVFRFAAALVPRGAGAGAAERMTP